MLKRLSGSEWHGIGKMWPEGLRAPPACSCIFGCIVACRVAQFSPNSTTYREAKLLSPHNRDVGLHIFKTGDRHLRCRWCVRLAHASDIILTRPPRRFPAFLPKALGAATFAKACSTSQ